MAPGCGNNFKVDDLYINEMKSCHVSDGCTEDKNKKAARNKGWGLRQFSTLVCNKVKAKGRTTYNEVADEIIREVSSLENTSEIFVFDEKNIRRRVYDAFNVLMAINVIAKDKKEVKWVGFPSTRSEDLVKLKEEHMKLLNKIQQKENYVKELQENYADINNLLLRNQLMYKSAESSSEGIRLPFLLVQTSRRATVEIDLSEDARFVTFDFNGTPFNLHDADSILKHMRHARLLGSGHDKISSADILTLTKSKMDNHQSRHYSLKMNCHNSSKEEKNYCQDP